MKDIHLVVSGSRLLTNVQKIYATLDLFVLYCEKHDRRLVKLTHGGARGLDYIAGEWAKERGFTLKEEPAMWELSRKDAGNIRNEVMADKADFVLAFLHPESVGTKNMIDYCKRKGIPYNVIQTDNEWI